MNAVASVLGRPIAAALVLLAGPSPAIAAAPPVIVEWPTLPGGRETLPAGPVEPAAIRGGVPRIDPRRPESDDDRRLREREEAARRSIRGALDEQDRRVREAVTTAPPPPAPVQNCGPGGCFDSRGRFMPRVGPALITPSGQPCLPTGTTEASDC